MSGDLGHLLPSVRPFAEECEQARVRRIRSDRWISYARADAALAAFDVLLTRPMRHRMPNLLLVGPTNNGKTMIVEKFRRMHLPRAASDSPSGVANVPVLKMQMPAGPDDMRFFGAILDALAYPHSFSDRGSKRQDAAMRLMRETEVRLIIIDEVYNLLAGTRLQQRRILNILRWLGNELLIPLVAVGTTEAFRAIQSDDQLANRFEPVTLPPWRNGQEYKQLLRSLEAVLPLRAASNLSEANLAARILSTAEGILGEVVSLVSRAAIQAIAAGQEAITNKTIDELGYVSPSQRRRAAI